jgi:hypothetical protein
MNGGTTLIKVTLRNPRDKTDLLPYWIEPLDNALARDWVSALRDIIQQQLMLEKNFCFLGFPNSQRDLDYLCEQLNHSVKVINNYNFCGAWREHGLEDYFIEDWYAPDVVRYGEDYPMQANLGGDHERNCGLQIKHGVMNRLHNHFERLQGTVEHMSPYYLAASDQVKYAIRQLNLLCHEIENLVLSQRKMRTIPEWVRPSQITTFLGARRHELQPEHRELFVTNGYDREFGTVYMHWCQIGKTLFEVWRDEKAPDLNWDDAGNIQYDTGAQCEAITALRYYSGEFDVEWAQDIRWDQHAWWRDFLGGFYDWLDQQGIDRNDPSLSLGYMPVGRVQLERSFGTKDMFEIWKQLETHLDIYSVEIDGVTATYDAVWSDSDFEQQQIERLKPGYHSQEQKHGMDQTNLE